MEHEYEVHQVKLAQLREPAVNPNIMSTEKYELLVHGMASEGFLQPPLVWDQGDGTYEIVDGVHRCRAARENNLETIPVMVLPASYTPAKVELVRLALNELRGETSTTRAAEVLLRVQEAVPGIDLTLSGYRADTAHRLVDSLRTPDLDDIMKCMGSEPAKSESRATYTLEIKFKSRGLLRAAKRALRTAAKGSSLAVGLLRLAGLPEEES